MTHQASPPYAPGLADAGAQIAQLRQVLALADEMAGRGGALPEEGSLEAAARISAAYEAALPIEQRRFDRLARETMAGATVGAEALLALQESGRPCGAAASVLAGTLESALRRLASTLYS